MASDSKKNTEGILQELKEQLSVLKAKRMALHGKIREDELELEDMIKAAHGLEGAISFIESFLKHIDDPTNEDIMDDGVVTY